MEGEGEGEFEGGGEEENEMGGVGLETRGIRKEMERDKQERNKEGLATSNEFNVSMQDYQVENIFIFDIIT